MQRLYPALALVLFACGGANDATKAKTGGAGESDKDFAQYAATHGITTLEGGGAAPEVTADGLKLEGIDKDRKVKLDGVLDEWPALAKATVSTGNTKSGLKIALQYDAGKLYVGADVSDASFSAGRDHVSLVLAVPTPGATYATYDIGLYAGKPGDSEGTVRYGRKGGIPGAKIVEAPETGGYSFEAVIPWSALPELRVTKVGIHGVATYVDGDGTIATGPGDAAHPRDMGWVPTEPELSMIEQLLQPKGLTKRAPDVELVADLTGDGVRERVAVWDNDLTICGTSYLGGNAYFVRELGGQLVKLEAREVTGRRGADVVVRRKQSVGDAEREYIEVLSALSSTAEPTVTFAHEIAIRQSDKRIDNSVHLGHGQIEVAIEPTTTWDALSYKEPIASDVEPILFPWGGVKSQTYKWDGSKFSKGKEIGKPDQTLDGGSGGSGRDARSTAAAPRRASDAEGEQGRRHERAAARPVPQGPRRQRRRRAQGRPQGAGHRRRHARARAAHRTGHRRLRPRLQGRHVVRVHHAAAVLRCQRHQRHVGPRRDGRWRRGPGRARHAAREQRSGRGRRGHAVHLHGDERLDHAHLRHRDGARAGRQARAGDGAVHPRRQRQDVRHPGRPRPRDGVEREDLSLVAGPARRTNRAAHPALERHQQRALHVERLVVHAKRRLEAMATEKLYWADPFATQFEATARAGQLGGHPSVLLDRTLFYPESGGQLADVGTLVVAGTTLKITDVQVDDDGLIHHLVEGAPLEGPASGTIEVGRRRDHMAQHTAQHALSRALVDVARAETISSRLGATSCTIDVEGALGERDLAKAEDMVNAVVTSDVVVRQLFPSAEELPKLPLRRPPKVTTGVRVIDIEGFDMSPCGGTHCTRTGQIGAVRVVDLEKYKGGWRVTFHAGRRALDDARRKDAVLGELARELTCGLLDVGQAVGKLRADLKARSDALSTARGELVELLAERILGAHPAPASGAGTTRIVVRRERDDLGMLRTLAGRLAARDDVLAFCAAPDEKDPASLSVVVQRGAKVDFDCGAWLKASAAKTGGRGGGRPERAEGRLPSSANLEELARGSSAP